MKYSEVCNEKISKLAFGCMRFPTIGGKGSEPIDYEETEKMVTYAYENGVNYFDTAYVYHNGESETVIGKILKKYPRESFYLATKLPGWEPESKTNPGKFFEEQLAKCQVDYFDFYLLHNVAEGHLDTYMNKDFGVVDYLLEQKAKGRIKHLGFSAHGRYETVKSFLEEFGDKMEFGQIQLNWLDWTLQDAEKMYNLLHEYNIPVWVMEPVRGGKLVNLAPKDKEKLLSLRPDESLASWAFRWLDTLPEVKTVLSGMSTFEQVEDNIKTYSTDKPLQENELNALKAISMGMLDLLPCTNCRYCVKDCPVGIDIPVLLAYYNNCRFEPDMNAKWGVLSLPEHSQPQSCIACGMCSSICPQNIDIPKELSKFVKILDSMPVG